MKTKKIILISITILVIILAGAGGFFGGMKLAQRGQRGIRQFNNSQFGQRSAFRPTAGEIISADDKSVTIKLADGSSKIVLVSDATQITKSDTASKSALVAGVQVTVFGTDNSDGSVTAQNVQMGQAFRMGRGN